LTVPLLPGTLDEFAVALFWLWESDDSDTELGETREELPRWHLEGWISSTDIANESTMQKRREPCPYMSVVPSPPALCTDKDLLGFDPELPVVSDFREMLEVSSSRFFASLQILHHCLGLFSSFPYRTNVICFHLV